MRSVDSMTFRFFGILVKGMTILLCQRCMSVVGFSAPSGLASVRRSSVHQSLWLPLRSTKRTSSSTDSASDTVTSITIPRFLDDDNHSGSHDYPSPLHHIHVIPILSDTETAHCYQLAHKHAAATGCWERPDRERHSAYSTCDFAVEECDALTNYLTHEIGFHDRLWGHLSRLYGVDVDDMIYQDLFCAQYQARQNDTPDALTTSMDRLEPHRDGTLLSFSLTLSSPDAFQGGGTLFDALRDVQVNEGGTSHGVLRSGGVVRPLRAGDAVLHSGKILHGADVVTAGERTVLVGFVDVAEWSIRPGVLANACREWGRMDVAQYRYNRQMRMTNEGQRHGWFLKTSRWLPHHDTNHSYVCGFCPAFDSVKRRADTEFQRREKLKVEDRLLRTMLLSDEEKKNMEPLDITIL